MPITVSISEAAHKHGLDDISFTRTPTFDTVMGNTASVSYSFSGPPPLNTSLTATLSTSNGFQIKQTFTLTSSTSGYFTNVTYSKGGETLLSGTGTLAFGSSTTSLPWATIFAGSDTVTGNSHNNVIQGGAGNDIINGGAGTDTAVFSAASASFTRTGSYQTSLTVSGPDGADTLTSIERLRFTDKTIAFDVNGAAGQAYRIYQAALNRAPEESGLGYYIKALDSGYALKDIAVGFLASAEFSSTYGSLSNTQFVERLYLNVLHRAGESSGVAFHVNALGTGTDRTQLLINFSESNENQVALVGTISAGVAYTG